jgi:anti-sigma B factor antagonist
MTEITSEAFRTIKRYSTDKGRIRWFPDMKDTLQIRIDSQNGALMYLQGRVDIESSPDLRDHLLAMLRKPPTPKTIIIDLKDVSYIDTSGIATLIEGLKIARIGNISMHLQGLQGHLLHLFQATGLASLFDIDGATDNLSTTTVF